MRLANRLLTDGLLDLAYSGEKELSSVWVTNQRQSEFLHDGLMRLRIRKEYVWASGAWSQTLAVPNICDGNLAIQERSGTNGFPATYTRGNDLSHTLRGAGGIGGLLARTDVAQWMAGIGYAAHAYYFSDANGNVVAMVNTNGALVAQYRYDPFGNVLAMSGSLASANVYRFSSKEWHQNSGLYYYGRRFYDPNLQRWANRDPLEEGAGVNLYSFVLNSPFEYDDPYGSDLAAAGSALAAGLRTSGLADAIGGGPEDPLADLVAGGILAGYAGYATYELFCSPSSPLGTGSKNENTANMSQNGSGGPGRNNPGERNQQGKSPNPDKTAGKPDNQTGKTDSPPKTPAEPEPQKQQDKPNDYDAGPWWNK